MDRQTYVRAQDYVVRSPCSRHYYYIFVRSSNTWAVGPYRCWENLALYNPYKLHSDEGPDEVLETWREHDSSLGEDGWVDNPDIRVACAQCTVLELSGASSLQIDKDGTYTKIEGSHCSDRITYIQASSTDPHYMYYMDELSDQFGKDTWEAGWLVGPEVCQESKGIYINDEAFSADKVKETRKHEYDNLTGEWAETTTIHISCAECEEVELSGALHHLECNGVYRMLSGVRSSSRPVYKRVYEPEFYMYYEHAILDEENNVQIWNMWIVSDSLQPVHNTSQARIVAYDTAFTPDLVTQPWLEYGYELNENETTVAVLCYEGSGGNDNGDGNSGVGKAVGFVGTVIIIAGFAFCVWKLCCGHERWFNETEESYSPTTDNVPPPQPTTTQQRYLETTTTTVRTERTVVKM